MFAGRERWPGEQQIMLCFTDIWAPKGVCIVHINIGGAFWGFSKALLQQASDVVTHCGKVLGTEEVRDDRELLSQ